MCPPHTPMCPPQMTWIIHINNVDNFSICHYKKNGDIFKINIVSTIFQHTKIDLLPNLSILIKYTCGNPYFNSWQKKTNLWHILCLCQSPWPPKVEPVCSKQKSKLLFYLPPEWTTWRSAPYHPMIPHWGNPKFCDTNGY